MRTVNMLEAKTQLSRLVDAVERGEEDEVIIARDGKPAARLVPLAKRRPVVLGLLKGKVDLPADWDRQSEALDREILRLMEEQDEAEPALADEAFILDPARLKPAR